ncbi:hypothetical protein GCM10029992_51350 [Glycomyces albus]
MEQTSDPNGDAVELGDIDPASCSLTFTATKREGREGFIIALGPDVPQSFLEIHIGFWQNKSTSVLRSDDGITCDDHGPLPWHGVLVDEPVRVAVRLEGPRVQVWVDGELRHDYEQDLRSEQRFAANAASRTRDDGATEYVIRVVNSDPVRRTATVVLPEESGPVAAAIRTLAGPSPDIGAPETASPWPRPTRRRPVAERSISICRRGR